MNSFQESEKTFQTLAPRLKYFSIHDALYNRVPGNTTLSYLRPPKDDTIGIYQEIQNPKHSQRSLLHLLKNPSPKVRTLAILALYSRENPTFLPELTTLANDPAPTYPEPQMWGMLPTETNIPVAPKTVGQIAQEVLAFYMTRAGYHYGLMGAGEHPGFEKYWQEHGKLQYCASWFSVKLARASQGTTPTPDGQIEAIKAVRKKLDLVPSPEREWILLSLQKEPGFDKLADEKDLVQAMRKLGAPTLMLMLQGKINTPDPDLQPRKSNNYPYQTMQLSILKHAKEVLRPEDAHTLIRYDRQKKDHKQNEMDHPLMSPWWVIAASHLAPAQSAKLLHDEFAFYDTPRREVYGENKAAIATALGQLHGLKEKNFLVDTFYNQSSPQGSCSYRCYWLSELANDKNAGKFIETIIKDKRFDSLIDSWALSHLASAQSIVKGKKVLNDDLWRKAWHPLGLDNACSDLETARKKYPKETAELLQVLKEWRSVIKQSLS